MKLKRPVAFRKLQYDVTYVEFHFLATRLHTQYRYVHMYVLTYIPEEGVAARINTHSLPQNNAYTTTIPESPVQNTWRVPDIGVSLNYPKISILGIRAPGNRLLILELPHSSPCIQSQASPAKPASISSSIRFTTTPIFRRLYPKFYVCVYVDIYIYIHLYIYISLDDPLYALLCNPYISHHRKTQSWEFWPLPYQPGTPNPKL